MIPFWKNNFLNKTFQEQKGSKVLPIIWRAAASAAAAFAAIAAAQPLLPPPLLLFLMFLSKWDISGLKKNYHSNKTFEEPRKATFVMNECEHNFLF